MTLQASLLPQNLKEHHPEFVHEPPLGVVAFEPRWSGGYSWEAFPRDGREVLVPVWYLLRPRKTRLPSFQERFLSMLRAALSDNRGIKLYGVGREVPTNVPQDALDEALALYRKKLDSP